MGVEGEKERYEEVVGVPERFVGLLAYSNVRGREHHEHAEQHDMTRNTASLGVVDLHSGLGSYLISFDIEEAVDVSEALDMNASRHSLDVMGTSMHTSPKEQRVSHLSVKPLRFIQRQPSYLRSYPS